MFTEKWTLDVPVDQLYTIALVAAVPLAFLVPFFKAGRVRAAYCSFVGAALLILLSGIEIAHWMVVTALSYILIKAFYKSKYCGPAVFIVAFGYQGLVRYTDITDIYKLGTAANTCMLMQALKVVAIAYDCQKLGESIHFNTFMHYLLFFPGIWSGPYLSFNDVMDTLSRDYNLVPRPNSLGFVVYRLVCGTWYIVFFIWVRHLYPPTYLWTSEFADLNIFKQIFTLHMVIISFRSRLCTCWAVADATSGAAGVFYNQEFRFKIDDTKMWNINCFEVEFAPSLQSEIRNWNRSVQTWMATYPYKYSPFSSRVLRQIYTMSVSAYWHGLNAGYYLAFSLFPIYQLAQDMVFDQPMPYERSSPIAKIFWDLVRRLVTGVLMSFNIIPFVFLTFEGSYAAWKNMRFYGFWMLISFFIIGYLTRGRRKAYKRELKEKKEGAAEKKAL